MGTLLLVVGLIWVLLGLLNLFGMDWTPGPDGQVTRLQTFGIMFNMLLFVLPGLVVTGIGYASVSGRAPEFRSPLSRESSGQRN